MSEFDSLWADVIKIFPILEGKVSNNKYGSVLFV